MPFGFHPLYLFILLAIVLIIFGPGKLPELGGALGRGIREFRKASDELKDEVTRAVEDKPSPEDKPAQATASSEAEPAKAEAERKSSK